MSNFIIQYSDLEWVSFDFNLQFLEPAFFNEYIGSVLRSTLGNALHNISDLPSYRYLFETPPTRPLPNTGYSSVPHPFVLRAPCLGQTWIPVGGNLSFNLTLIGKGISYFSYFFEAIRFAGDYGIGLKPSRFEITSVESVGLKNERRLIFSKGDKSFDSNFFRLSIRKFPSNNINPIQALMSFITPVRLKDKGKYIKSENFSFEAYTKRFLERIQSLGYFHNGIPWLGIDTQLIEKAQEVSCQSWLQWQDWRIWVRNRHQKLGGLVGQVILQGDLSLFYYMLRSTEWLSVGKNTSYGFGAVKIQI